MTEMTPRELASKIKKLKAKPLGATQYERELVARGIWSANGVWYTSQKEHWLGWLSEYNGPGAYDRKIWRGRSAKFAYNHPVSIHAALAGRGPLGFQGQSYN